MKLVELSTMIPNLVIDMRYTTRRNITGTVLSSLEKSLLRPDVATKLASAANEFAMLGYRLVIWDAYRNMVVQEELKRLIADRRYVKETSHHCEGTAIDITLATSGGILLDMGTDYDDFTDRAHVDCRSINQDQAKNRSLLRTIMERNGFTVWPYEWWHFDSNETLE